MSKEKVIWSNDTICFEDWDDFIKEYYPDSDYYEQYNAIMNMLSEYLEDECINHRSDITDGYIIAIADLGLWNGRHSGYKIISNCISDCFYNSCDYGKFYIDKLGDFRFEGTHHDGHNYILFRELKHDLGSVQVERLEEKILNGTLTRKDIIYYTKSLGKYFE